MSGCGQQIEIADGFTKCGTPTGIHDGRYLCIQCGGAFNKVLDACRDQPQSDPAKKGKVVIDDVITDLKARSDIGVIKYGQRLRTNNGRCSTLDAYQEACDMLMYTKQRLMELQVIYDTTCSTVVILKKQLKEEK